MVSFSWQVKQNIWDKWKDNLKLTDITTEEKKPEPLTRVWQKWRRWRFSPQMFMCRTKFWLTINVSAEHRTAKPENVLPHPKRRHLTE
jgi:hypothetical protein